MNEHKTRRKEREREEKKEPESAEALPKYIFFLCEPRSNFEVKLSDGEKKKLRICLLHTFLKKVDLKYKALLQCTLV